MKLAGLLLATTKEICGSISTSFFEPDPNCWWWKSGHNMFMLAAGLPYVRFCVFFGRWGGVGWGGLGWGGLITFNGTSTHTWCYATGLFSCTCTHSWCYATDLVSCTCTHSWCYATRLFSCTSTHSCARKKPKSPNFLFSPCGETQIHQKTRHPETASFYSWRSQKRAKTSEKWWKNKTQWN